MQQCVRVYRALENGLTDGGGVTLAVMRDRKLIELVLQSNELGIEICSLPYELSAGLPFSAHEADGIGATRG